MARPSKRRQQATTAQTVTAEQFAVIHKTAIYARLSREDNLNQSDSIENQELICKGWFLPPNTYDCGSFVVN